MPILLDTPETIHIGHGVPDATHGEVKIIDVQINIAEKGLRLRCQYGDTDAEGNWIAGRAVVDHLVVDEPPHIGAGGVEIPADPAFSTMAATTVTQGPAGSNLYQEVAGAFYSLLVAQGIYQGTIQ